MVNWCPASQSAVSDLEVESREVDGNLWHFRYPLTDGSGYVEVATTRPETMLGDTAVAVNPDDERYKELVGKTLMLPIMQREIPIIADEYVDASFGTGCVKVTPAHDLNDFEMGKRHDLPFINILNKDGTLNENVAPEFQGLDRFDARKKVVERLDSDGFLVRVEDYKHTVPYSDRGKVPVEPLISTQWFVKIRPLADKALDFLDNQDEPIFVPERWTKVYRDWLVSLRDWCISRQLWWGHQIPAWYAVSETGGSISDDTPFVVASSEEEARQQLVAQFGESVEIQQDPDVLDTWFSSGLWPFSTMGWPDNTTDLATYYPTTTLVTGFDIIFFWVARMTMMAGHFTGKMPFQSVYIHGLVRDENNKKMSKSSNNGIDPLLLINKYGTDALRYTLIREVAGAGQDIRLAYNRKTDESESVEASRNFTNKLWNASRFVLMNLNGKTPDQLGKPNLQNLELADRWILSRYNQVVQQTHTDLDKFGMGEAAKGLYEFIWGDFCDWYIELVKSRLQQTDSPTREVAQQTLAYVLEGTLRLLHPFMPHITEELWQTLTQANQEKVLALQAYPEPEESLINTDLEEQFKLLIGTIRTVRNLRAEAEIKPSARICTILKSDSLKERLILSTGQDYIKDLARVEELTIEEPEGTETSSSTQQAVMGSVMKILDGLRPSRLAKYRRPVVSLGLIFLTVLSVKLTISVVTTIHRLVILTPFLQLIGVTYFLWFSARFLVFAEGRDKLSAKIEAVTTPATERLQALKQTQTPAISTVADPQPEAPQQMVVGVIGTVQVLVPLEGVADITALRTKIERDLGKVEGDVQSLTNRLANEGFVKRAPADVVEGARAALEEAQIKAEILRDRQRNLQ